MTQDKTQQKRKRFKFWLFKIPLVLMVISAILIGALLLVERYPEPLRQGFEQYLSRISGGSATIGTLKDIKFFPHFVLSAEDITIHNGRNAAIIDVEIKSFLVDVPFSNLFFNKHKFHEFILEDMTAGEGILGPKKIKISKAEIVNKEGPDQFGSFIVADGMLNEHKAFFEAELEVRKYHYRLPAILPFSLKVGDYELNATLNRSGRDGKLENAVLTKSDNTSSPAIDYALSQKKELNEDNPLTCLLIQENLTECSKYLTKEN